MSRSRAMRPLIKYSLCPERYSRRLTTTSPGFVAGTGLSSAFFFLLNKLLNLPTPAAEASAVLSVASICASGACAAASARNSLVFGACSEPVAVTSVFDSFVSSSPAAVSITNRAASASSGSSIVMVTSARPIGGRLVVPLKIQSAMRSARSDLWLCSPKTQEMASTTFDLPQPLGPTIHVVPEPLNVTTVRSQNDLKPTISTFRSFSKRSPFSPRTPRKGPLLPSRQPAKALFTIRPGGKTRGERRHCIPREEGSSSNRSARNTPELPAATFGRFSIRGPAAWRKDGGTKKTLTRCFACVKHYAASC